MAPTCRSRAEAAALLVLVLTTTSGVARAVTPRAPAALLVLVLTTMSGCCMGRGQFSLHYPLPLRATAPYPHLANFSPYGRDMPGEPRATDQFSNG